MGVHSHSHTLGNAHSLTPPALCLETGDHLGEKAVAQSLIPRCSPTFPDHVTCRKALGMLMDLQPVREHKALSVRFLPAGKLQRDLLRAGEDMGKLRARAGARGCTEVMGYAFLETCFIFCPRIIQTGAGVTRQ